MPQYPIMKAPVPAGKVLNFKEGSALYLVIKSDGVIYNSNGYTLVCECIQNVNENMVGEEYNFDDRAFRDCHDNRILVEEITLHPIALARYEAKQSAKRQKKSEKSQSAYKLLLSACQSNDLGVDMQAHAEAFLVSLLHLSDQHKFDVEDLLDKAQEIYQQDNK